MASKKARELLEQAYEENPSLRRQRKFHVLKTILSNPLTERFWKRLGWNVEAWLDRNVKYIIWVAIVVTVFVLYLGGTHIIFMEEFVHSNSPENVKQLVENPEKLAKYIADTRKYVMLSAMTLLILIYKR